MMEFRLRLCNSAASVLSVSLSLDLFYHHV
jgi:hypothetical protein